MACNSTHSMSPRNERRGGWCRRAVLVWLWCAAAVTQGATLDGPTLPAEVQSCVGAGLCSVSSEILFKRGAMTAYGYQSEAGSGYLVRYELDAASRASDSSDSLDTSVEPAQVQHFVTQSPLFGSLWLAVRERYAMTASDHGVVLYLDQVQPADRRVVPRLGVPNPYPDILHFYLSHEALLTAGAYHNLVLDAEGSREDGDLRGAEALLPCVADGCRLTQQLALIGLRYHSEGDELVAQFAADDRRHLYFEQTAFAGTDNGFNNFREYVVRPLPLPGAGGMALLGVVAMLRTAKRSARQCGAVA